MFFFSSRTNGFPFLIASIVGLLCIVSSDTMASEGQIRSSHAVVVIHCDYRPVSFWDRKTDKPSGFFVDLMESIAARAGLQVNYVCKSGWNEIIEAIENGEADVGALMKSEEREKKLLFSAPIDTTYLSFFGRSQSSIDVDKLPKGYTIGVIKGSMSYEQLKNRPGVILVTYGSYQDGLFGLLAGEIGIFAGEESMVMKRARETRLDDRIKKVGRPFLERERGLAVRKDNTRLLGSLNKAMAGFIQSPEYQRIYLKWYGAPVPYWTADKVLGLSGILLFVAVCGMASWRYVSVSRLNKELVSNISERRKTEEALKKSEEKFFKAFMLAPAGISISSLNDGRILDVNEEYERLFGYNRTEVIGRTSIDLGLWPDAADRDRIMGLINDTGRAKNLEVRLRAKGGDVLMLRYAAQSLKLDEKSYMVSAFVDVTERRRAEEALRRSEEMMRSVLDSVDEGFIVVDRDYRIVTANRAYCRQINLSCEEIIGKHCYEVSHRRQLPCFEAGEECAVKELFEKETPSVACHQHSAADGGTLYVETKAFPLKDSSGKITSAIESISNITERHLLEEERLKTQKLEAIGTLAGGIAHDFNNLLQGVFGFISLAKLTADDKEKSISSLEQAERALHMSVKLTNQLLTFSRGGKPVKKPFNLGPVIENATKFAVSGSRTDYHLQIDEGLPDVEADEGQIGQVIQNIVLNADQAMPMGGTISIAARNVHSPGTGVPSKLRTGVYVEVSIRDSGMGIPEQYLPRIFDPYFSTKERGSGLGLATSYSIIKNHNGLIDVRSEIGKGSIFTIYLPAVMKEQKPGSLKPSPKPSPARSGRVLLMDDEDIVRDVAGEMVKSLGHGVELAEHGAQAIERFRLAIKAGMPFDVVILDLTIRGGMGGIETLKRLREEDPNVKAVVSSGYSNDSGLSEYEGQGFAAVLMKPYTIEGLRETIDRLLK